MTPDWLIGQRSQTKIGAQRLVSVHQKTKLEHKIKQLLSLDTKSEQQGIKQRPTNWMAVETKLTVTNLMKLDLDHALKTSDTVRLQGPGA